MGRQSEDNTKCDIEIGQVPVCAKCCILRKGGAKGFRYIVQYKWVILRPWDCTWRLTC
jgi:hypothetical protein